MTKLSSLAKRMWIVVLLVTALFSYVVWKLHQVQIERHGELIAKARAKYTCVKTTAGNRGEIYDVNGNLLVSNIPCSDVCADPSIAGPGEKSREIAKFLAKKLNLKASEVYEKLADDTIRLKKKDGSVETRARKFVIIKPKVDYEIAERLKVETEKLGYKCIYYRETTRRNYPKKQLLANILGFTNIDRDRVVAVIGLEKFFDKPMRSAPGVKKYERSRDGLPITYGDNDFREVKDGLNVYLTINEAIQSILEEELDLLMAKSNPNAAYAVMADPYTGKIIAAAQRPTFDPNDRANMNPKAWRSRISEDIFEPGSTIKPLAVAGALDNGVVRPGTLFDCEKGHWYYGGKRLKDSHPLGKTSVSDIIKESSNIGTAKIALEMGEPLLDKTLRQFGIGQKSGVPLKPETSGIFRPLKRWDKLSITRFPIGQGLAVSPLQLVRAYCILANGGHPIKLSLVDRMANPETGIIQKFPVENPPSFFRRSETYPEIVDMMKKVTGPGGTARQAAVKGYYVAGKTGTAQKFVNGQYSKSQYIANFIGFVPADKPKFVLLVTADEPKGGYYGGKVAGPVFAAIAERTLKYWNVPQDYDYQAEEAAKKAEEKRKREERYQEWLKKKQLEKQRNQYKKTDSKKNSRVSYSSRNR